MMGEPVQNLPGMMNGSRLAAEESRQLFRVSSLHAAGLSG
jgi:hypothetical protein